MPKTKRERILLGLTVAAIVIFVAYRMFDDTDIFSGLSGSRGKIKELEKTRAEYLEILADQERIEKLWGEIGQGEERPAGLTPERHFSEIVNKMCRDLKLLAPQIDPSELEDIPDVPEYRLIYLSVSFSGPWDKVAELLKQLDNRGYLIETIVINSNRDSDIVQVRQLDIAQPVKRSEVGKPGAT